MLLSIRMKEHGFVTAYLNEKLSLGLAPEGIGEYCTQRIRWCIGAMQIMRSADGLFSRKGLNWIDRMSLMETLLYWMRSEEHTSELQSLMRISYAVFCLQKKKKKNKT